MQQIKKIGERFWYQTPVSETDRPILGMVVGDKQTLMIDAGNSEAHANYFLEELKKRKVPEPKLLVLTHWHWDHIFGLSTLDVVSISSHETKQEMEKLVHLGWSDRELDERVRQGTEIEFCATAIKKEFVDHREITIARPDITFEGNMEIDLGGVTCQLHQVGGDHAKDSTVIYIKEEKILFLGDCFYPDIFSPKTNYTVNTTLTLLDKLEMFDAEWFILSHGSAISKEEFMKEVAMLRTMASLTNECNGNHVCMTEKYINQVGRDLTEDEMELLQEFVNGMEIEE
ncbi:MBL fold metallo-hydrolase [Guptibacillus hwajinpoensis]|uniref:Glyoxylase-like metal-dependent hydrolase (Beta-lactamase superfamily II) n=1 Tax=Guptibacillus hwajinpoensis TaxID=208199 RepID=A0ABU0K2U1_9BACL|nr:MBL fold metallo-hydrolase [Alkalihalobacillus hemicentroti]MDQ0483677.1 glyoxylase-like metal-dependent hydrolase (beta-lactamase superfamily II) [Alkalihalobacillus hemicentroti]